VTLSLLPLAALGDRLEYRRIYRAGLAVFTLASFACAVSDSLLTLALSRILQGLGAAGIMSVNIALTRFIYPRDSLGRGVGINALVVAVSAAIGPTVAAAILAVGPWQWLFAVNVPIGIVALAAARSLPATRRSQQPFDVLGAILNALTFGLLIAGIDGIGHHQGGLEVGGELVGAAAIGVVLVRRELARPAPLLPLDLLRIRIFALSVSTSVCSFTAQMMAYVSLPFYLQNVLGRTQVETGLLMTPWPLMTAVIAPIAGRLADRHSAGLLGGLGLAIFSLGLVLLALLPPSPASLDIVWRMAICGFGFGLFQSPNNRAMIAAAPKARSGGASGALGTARLLGQTTGAALVALIFGRFPSEGTTVALATASGVAAVAAAVSCTRMLEFGKTAEAPEREASD
jgi:DHA2 family multidrug resistance protein-like MFS transporter